MYKSVFIRLFAMKLGCVIFPVNDLLLFMFMYLVKETYIAKTGPLQP